MGLLSTFLCNPVSFVGFCYKFCLFCFWQLSSASVGANCRTVGEKYQSLSLTLSHFLGITPVYDCQMCLASGSKVYTMWRPRWRQTPPEKQTKKIKGKKRKKVFERVNLLHNSVPAAAAWPTAWLPFFWPYTVHALRRFQVPHLRRKCLAPSPPPPPLIIQQLLVTPIACPKQPRAQPNSGSIQSNKFGPLSGSSCHRINVGFHANPVLSFIGTHPCPGRSSHPGRVRFIVKHATHLIIIPPRTGPVPPPSSTCKWFFSSPASSSTFLPSYFLSFRWNISGTFSYPLLLCACADCCLVSLGLYPDPAWSLGASFVLTKVKDFSILLFTSTFNWGNINMYIFDCFTICSYHCAYCLFIFNHATHFSFHLQPRLMLIFYCV